MNFDQSTSSKDNAPIKIDGTLGEGGGAILRVAAGMACQKMKPINVINIRSNRSNPGLRLQHLIGLQTLKRITGGFLSEAEVGTQEITFKPGSELNGKLDVDIRTAGSIGLLTQTLQNSMILNKRNNKTEATLNIHVHGGGTFGLGAPDPHYLNDVTFYYFNKMGYYCNIDVIKEGFYPKGGAEAVLNFKSVDSSADLSGDFFKKVLDDRGTIKKLGGSVIVSENLRKPRVGERIKDSFLKEFLKQNNSNFKDEIDIKYVKTLNPGVGLSIYAEFTTGVRIGSGTILGKRGVPSEVIGKKCARSLINELKNQATVDSHLSDQILPVLYLAKDSIPIVIPKITSHFETNLKILNLFGERNYKITQDSGKIIFSYDTI